MSPFSPSSAPFAQRSTLLHPSDEADRRHPASVGRVVRSILRSLVDRRERCPDHGGSPGTPAERWPSSPLPLHRDHRRGRSTGSAAGRSLAAGITTTSSGITRRWGFPRSSGTWRLPHAAGKPPDVHGSIASAPSAKVRSARVGAGDVPVPVHPTRSARAAVQRASEVSPWIPLLPVKSDDEGTLWPVPRVPAFVAYPSPHAVGATDRVRSTAAAEGRSGIRRASITATTWPLTVPSPSPV